MSSPYDNGGIIGPVLDLGTTDFYQVTIPRGEAEYTTAGSYSWTAPAGVTSVDVVCVGGGGGGAKQIGSGGGGGGLGYKNNITVVPGNSYTVVVGSGGAAGTSVGNSGVAGGNSYFIDTSTVAGLSGTGGNSSTGTGGTGGSYVGDGGGNGGNGGNATSTSAGGGGGAGGYSGNGGAGGGTSSSGSNGSGGGGGGGGAGGSGDGAGGGGGVGIYGEGTSGTGGTAPGADGNPGTGGSSGSNGDEGDGGEYGGGGGGSDSSFFITNQGPGSSGAVRIIWGGNRAFPSTNTADSAGDTTADANKKNAGIWNLNSIYNQLIAPPIGAASSTFVGSYGIASGITSYNFTTATISAGLVVVVAHNETNGTTAIPATSVTIGGVSATKAVESDSDLSGSATHTSIWYAVISSSTTSVTVAYGSSPLRSGIGVYTITGHSSTTPTFTGSDADGGTATASLSVTTPEFNSGYVMIGGHTSGDQYAHTWSGVTERYDNQVGGGASGQTGGSLDTSSIQTHTITSTTDGTPTQGTSLAVAVWR